MKLGELRALIRKTKGNVWNMQYPFPGTDVAFRMVLQKTPLLEELERVYPGGKAVETGLEFNPETGCLSSPATAAYVRATCGDYSAALAPPPNQPGTGSQSVDDLDLDLDDAPAAAAGDDDDLLV